MKHKLIEATLNMGKYRNRTPTKSGYVCENCGQSFLPPTKADPSWKVSQEIKDCLKA